MVSLNKLATTFARAFDRLREFSNISTSDSVLFNGTEEVRSDRSCSCLLILDEEEGRATMSLSPSFDMFLTVSVCVVLPPFGGASAVQLQT